MSINGFADHPCLGHTSNLAMRRETRARWQRMHRRVSVNYDTREGLMWYRRELEKWQESLETCEIVLPWESFTSISHRYSSD
jgi:hypothetical protein